MIYYVYLLKKPCGEPFYVGMGKNRRAWDVKRRNRFVLAIIAKLNELGQEIVREIIPCKNRESALQLEIKLIAKFGRRDLGTGSLANLSPGGEGSDGQDPEVIARRLVTTLSKPYNQSERHRMSELGVSRRGCTLSEDHKKAVGNSKRGLTQSQYSLEMRRATLKEAYKSGRIQPNRSMLGKRHSPETIEKMRQSALNRKTRKET